MNGIIRFYYNEKNEEIFESSSLKSYKIEEVDEKFLKLILNTSERNYEFKLVPDDCWHHDLKSMNDSLSESFGKVLKGINCCKFYTHKERYYVNFNFYEDYDKEIVKPLQFSGEYIEQIKED